LDTAIQNPQGTPDIKAHYKLAEAIEVV